MDDAAVLKCVHRYCLRLPRTLPRGRDGDRLGAGSGSSLEFQDYRGYVPGDDPRHIDWSAYARSDQLVVRLYREEVAPRVELVVDGSRSMASTPAKEARTRELLGLIHELCRADRLLPALWVVRERGERFPRDVGERLREFRPEGISGLEAVLRHAPALQRNAIRIVVSDFLFPAEPGPLVRVLARGAAQIALVQVLDGEEEAPSLAGGKRLLDVETAQSLDLVVTPAAREAYARRLQGMQDGYRRALRQAGGRFAAVSAARTLEENARGPLREAGILSVRGAEGT